jgi:2-keto-4-pentenoate hydratase
MAGTRGAGEAARILWKLWSERETIDQLPPHCRPQTLDEGWAVQRMLDRYAGTHAGWKIAATSAAGQQHIGANAPLAGRLYDHCLLPSGARLDADALTMRSVEAEFAFRVGEDIKWTGQTPTPERLLGAVRDVIPALEVPDSRFNDFRSVGLPNLLADAMCAAHAVVGQSQIPNELLLVDQPVTIRRNGRAVSSGSGALVLGHPLVALGWLVTELGAHGEMLREGDVVLTGAATTPVAITAGDEVSADFAALGTVRLCF